MINTTAITIYVITKTAIGIVVTAMILKKILLFTAVSVALTSRMICQVSIASVATTAIAMGIYKWLSHSAIIKTVPTKTSAASSIKYSTLYLIVLFLSLCEQLGVCNLGKAVLSHIFSVVELFERHLAV